MFLCILVAGIKATSSLKLRRDPDVTQKIAWHLVQRIHEAWNTECEPFMVPIGMDDHYISRKEKNKHADKKLNAGRGTVERTAVVGANDREIRHAQAQVVADTTIEPLKGFLYDTSGEETQVYTDGARFCHVVRRAVHATVKHSVKEYVNGMAHINGMEFFRSLPKHGYDGIYHKMSPKYLQRYENEFQGRHNSRNLDAEKQTEQTQSGLLGKDITDKRLTRKTKLDPTAV